MSLKAVPILLHSTPSAGRPAPPPHRPSRSGERSGGRASRLIAALAITTAVLSGTLAGVSASLDDPVKSGSHGPGRVHEQAGLNQHPPAGRQS